MMKLALLPLVAAMWLASASGLLAQNNTPPANTVEPATSNAKQPNNQSGTAPENMGATGWTGGSRGQTQDSATSKGPDASAKDAESAKGQPLMATGSDLKGKPTQFPANKTPE